MLNRFPLELANNLFAKELIKYTQVKTLASSVQSFDRTEVLRGQEELANLARKVKSLLHILRETQFF